MRVLIKPFSEEYTEQCADLLQYLWKEEGSQRLSHFKWEYLNNPNNNDVVTAIIALNEDGEVVGFRGYHVLQIYFGNKKERIAYMADTVVSPKARRQGIFQRMTEYSLVYLKEHGILYIGNLSPSWPPYWGYKKLDFEDLSRFNRKFQFYLMPYLEKIGGKQRDIKQNENKQYKNEIEYTISCSVPDDVLAQIPQLTKENKIYPCRDFSNLKWKSEHPGCKYVYAYSLRAGKLVSFLWFKTSDGFRYFLAAYYSKERRNFKLTYKKFRKIVKPSVVEVWTWALSDEAKECLKALWFIKIPFLNKIKNTPPSLVRTLKTNDEGELDWYIEGVDIRDVNNWVIDKFEMDSF